MISGLSSLTGQMAIGPSIFNFEDSCILRSQIISIKYNLKTKGRTMKGNFLGQLRFLNFNWFCSKSTFENN